MPNRLARETSPYLKQHAENPVDWYPWGDEARERARSENRPILLSVGYSSCHWCHVMERESFEDPETARIMNEGFVNVKVDREERPDVDGIYMRAVQALTGHGGWPLTVFLTPEGEPFYGGTYFPPEPRHGMASFRQVLEATRQAWEGRRDEVRNAASRIREALERSTLEPVPREGEARPVLSEDLVHHAARAILQRYDPGHGGFGPAPKFPQPVVLDFLLELHAFTGDRQAVDAVAHTLRRMARGGIRDHLGGGFHRYSVDERWLVPHFEKMLYDNALLAGTYLRGWQITGDAEFEAVCRAVLDDLLDDFRSPEGGFYSARDADSEGDEGTFYLWDRAEVDALLPEADARIFRRCYDVSDTGNFEGRNILNLPHDLEAVCRAEGLSREELDRKLARCREVLEEARAKREPPLRDEKILAGWNGLAFRTFAEAGAALDEPRYLEAARTGARWLLEALRPEGLLLHQITDGRAGITAFLEDVAALGNAVLSLHEATLDPEWLAEAIRLDEEMEARFRDPETGLLFDAPVDGERLVIRPRETTDTAVPSGTSLAAELRLRLARILADEARGEDARGTVARAAPGLERIPQGFGRLLTVAARLVHPSTEIVLVGPREDPAARALLREAHRTFVPGRVVTGAEGADAPDRPDTPLLEGRGTVDGRPAAYVCRDFACRAPVTDPEALLRELGPPS